MAEAIEQASQLTIDRCKYEFLAGINDQLRRAQARVIAHVRMENRKIMKFWQLRLRKDIVTWMAKNQSDQLE
jgi:hypothetical protein